MVDGGGNGIETFLIEEIMYTEGKGPVWREMLMLESCRIMSLNRQCHGLN